MELAVLDPQQKSAEGWSIMPRYIGKGWECESCVGARGSDWISQVGWHDMKRASAKSICESVSTII